MKVWEVTFKAHMHVAAPSEKLAAECARRILEDSPELIYTDAVEFYTGYIRSWEQASSSEPQTLANVRSQPPVADPVPNVPTQEEDGPVPF